MVTDFEPWRRVDQLPARAPIRHVRPEALPKPEQVRPRGEAPRFTAYVLEPRFGAVWAQGNGAAPAVALGAQGAGRVGKVGNARLLRRLWLVRQVTRRTGFWCSSSSTRPPRR